MNNEKARVRKRISSFFSKLVLILITAVSIYPFYSLLIMATHSDTEVITQLNLLPGNSLIHNARIALSTGFLRSYWNSFYVAVVSSVIRVLISAMAGYALAKYRFRGRELCANIVLMTMMVPFNVCLIGFLIEMRAFHLTGTIWPLIISCTASSMGVYLLMSVMQDTVPTEIIESARIDGAGEFSIFVRFAIPLSRAPLMTLFLLSFIASWNNFMNALIFINKKSQYTLPMAIFTFGDQYNSEYGARMLALALATFPILIIYMLNSKHLVSGLSAGAVKA